MFNFWHLLMSVFFKQVFSVSLTNSSVPKLFGHIYICLLLMTQGTHKSSVSACGGGKSGTNGSTGNGGNGNTGNGNSNSANGVLARKTGGLKDFSAVPSQDDSIVAQSPEELSCSSDSTSTGCCWRDAASGGKNGAPEIDFRALTGTADRESMRQNFDGYLEVPPGPGVIAAYTEGRVDASESAALESCKICLSDTNQNLRVELTHWATPGTTLEACVSPADSYRPMNCRSVDVGPQVVELRPLNEPFRLVFRAGTFLQRDGSIVAIDNVRVFSPSQFTDCRNAVNPTDRPVDTTGGDCGTVQCSFDEGSPCQYRTAAVGMSRGWMVSDRQIGNLNTGVRGAAPQSPPFYAGTNVPKGGRAIMRSGVFESATPWRVTFYSYEATQQIRLKACIDGESQCCWESNPGVSRADLRWQLNECILEPGAREIWFVAENVGNQYGAAGIDDIRVTGEFGEPIC